jgi:hypothetical protein
MALHRKDPKVLYFSDLQNPTKLNTATNQLPLKPKDNQRTIRSNNNNKKKKTPHLTKEPLAYHVL